MATKKKITEKKTTKKTSKKKVDLKAEADKLVKEMLRMQGIEDKKPSNEISSDETVSKVDDFLKSLQEEVNDTNIPLDWQPIMNILTRMYESGEDRYEHVNFYKSKGIIVNLNKKRYNPEMELQRIKFNISSSSFNYDLQEDNDKFVITISLI